MLLCTDVGNTNIKFALYDGEKQVVKLRFSTDQSKTNDDFAVELYTIFKINEIDVSKIDSSIISSVVPKVTKPLRQAIRKVAGVESLVVGPGIKTGLDIRTDNPAKVGADLACACVAVKELYSTPAVIIGLGTATTVLYMNENKAYCGGTIFPGVQISLDALTAKCALLPSVDISGTKKIIGTSTPESIRSGIIYGTASMIDGMIDLYEKETGKKCTIVATGGFASTIIKYCSKNITVDDNLIFEGLKIIYNKNKN